MHETKLGFLEKTGSSDVQELVAEVRRLRAALQAYKNCPQCGTYRNHRHSNE